MSEGLRETFIKYLTGFVLVLIVIGGLVMMYPNYRRSESLKRQNAELQARIDRKKAEIAKLAENQRRFRSDADFVEAILTTNTSGLSIDSIAVNIAGKHRFLGMHWMNPAHLIPCIEIIRGSETDDASTEAVIALAHAVGKKTTVCKKDVPGFILNRIQLAILRECISLVEDGIADIADVDACMKYGLGFRYAAFGPFEVVDFGGIDTFHHIASYLNAELCNATDVQKLLDDHYKRGEFGVKSGKGFYDYADGRDAEALRDRDEKFLKIYNALYRD